MTLRRSTGRVRRTTRYAVYLDWTLFDVGVGLFLALGIVLGLNRGLSGESARTAGALVVVWAGFAYRPHLEAWLLDHTRAAAETAPALAFFFLVAGGMLVFAVLHRLLKPLLRLTFSGAPDRIGGVVAGALRAVVLLGALMFFLSLCPVDYLQDYVFQRSLTGRIYERYVKERLERLWPAAAERAKPEKAHRLIGHRGGGKIRIENPRRPRRRKQATSWE